MGVSFAKALAIATLCFCPPDNFEHLVLIKSVSPTLSMIERTPLFHIGARLAVKHESQFNILIHSIAVYQVEILKDISHILSPVFFKVGFIVMAGLLTIDIHFPFFGRYPGRKAR